MEGCAGGIARQFAHVPLRQETANVSNANVTNADGRPLLVRVRAVVRFRLVFRQRDVDGL